MGADGKVMQKMVTLSGGSANTHVVQTVSGYVDVGSAQRATLRIQVLNVSECALYIETSSIKDSATNGGHWLQPLTVNAVTSGTTYYFEVSASATYKLERFLRWRVKSAGTVGTPPWTITFWIAVNVVT
jgi:hypothetical protein